MFRGSLSAVASAEEDVSSGDSHRLSLQGIRAPARALLPLSKVNELDALSAGEYGCVLSNQEHGENSRGLQDATMPAPKADKTSKPAVRKPARRTAAQRQIATTLPKAMTGKSSPANAAVGD